VSPGSPRPARCRSYTYDPDRKIITLTTFRKQRNNERRAILRARRTKQAHDQTREA
jgi:sortase (surface protein transpeptidase)